LKQQDKMAIDQKKPTVSLTNVKEPNSVKTESVQKTNSDTKLQKNDQNTQK